LPFPDRSFDVVFSIYCLEHLPAEYAAAIREMLRVAARRVVLIEPVPGYREPLQRVYAWACDYLRGLPEFLEREGIPVESVELLGCATNPLNMGARIVLVPSGGAAGEVGMSNGEHPESRTS
jgi:SAM-dependent methyltransferase